MKKIFATAAVILVGTALVWMAGANVLSGTAVDRGWASDDFVHRLPHNAENESATRILADAERLGDVRSVRGELRAVLRGKAPSAAVEQFLDKNANTIRTLRAEIISNPPPVWAADPEEILDPVEPPLAVHLQLYTILGADAALQRARGNERAAESDLRSVSILARSLQWRPDTASLIVSTIGYRISAPAAVDLRPSLLRVIEYDAWLIRAWAVRYPAGAPDGSQLEDTVRRIVTPVVRPIRVLRADVELATMRRMYAGVAAAAACAPLQTSMPEWQPLFERINRLTPPCPSRR